MASPLLEFAIVFSIIGLIELTDRTSLALIGLASRQPPRSTWLGASGAFLITSAVAVLIGTAFLELAGNDIRFVQLGGGVFILAYAGYLAYVPEAERAPPTGRSAAVTAFLWILLLELGDSTMILIILFTGSGGNPLVVFVAGALALVLVAGFACTLGGRLGTKVDPKKLEKAVIIVLVIVGVFTIVYALAPGLFPAAFG